MKEKMKNSYISAIASALFGCVAFLFWWRIYPYHLHYQEQFQMFLFTTDYWVDKLSHPGGIAEYLAEFLTQFYYYAWAGALIIAIALVILQRQVAWLSARSGAHDLYQSFTFLPSVCLWVYLCDENAMLAFALSLILTLYAVMVYCRLFSNAFRRTLYAILLIPLLYWMVGGVSVIFALWVTVEEVRQGYKRRGLLKGGGRGVIFILLWVICPLNMQNFVQFPLASLFSGINYYRFPLILPKVAVLTAILTLLIPLTTRWLTVPRKKRAFWLCAQALLLIVGSAYWIHSASDPKKEEAMMYDYLTRNKEWNVLIKKAEAKGPDSPFSITCLNLALAKTGQLGDRMFHFYQNGTEGLIPEFQRDFTSPLPTSEIFYHLGMINSSQRYMFEAMESIPDYKKSARAFQRLAETNLINGEYVVAAKYLRALQHTLFYKDWATEAMTYLDNDAKIEKHPEWGWLRKARYGEDFLFSNTEMDMMLGLLLQHNPQNRLAFEYLLAYVLQQKDLERFLKYYPLGKDLGYDHIPVAYQEALIFVWTQQHSNFQGLPWSISRPVMEGVTEFASVYTKQQDSEPLLKPKYEKTFWYYLLFRK